MAVNSRRLGQNCVCAGTRMNILTRRGYPGVITEGWLAVVAPSGISSAVRQKLSDEIRKIMGSAEVQAMAHTFGGIAPQMTLEQANSYVRAEGKRWFDIIRSAGIKLE